MAQNEDKDFLDFEVDDPLAAVGEEAAPQNQPELKSTLPGVLLYRKY